MYRATKTIEQQVAQLSQRAHCRVGQFWRKHKWKTILCTKRCFLHDIQTLHLAVITLNV